MSSGSADRLLAGDIGGTKTLALDVTGAPEIITEQRVPRPHGPDETVD